MSLNNFNIEGNQCLHKPIHMYHETIEGKCYECCVEKRKRKSWLKNADDGWTKFVPSSFAKLVYIYIYFSLTCISRFCLQKLVTDFSRNTAFRKKTLLNYLFFFFAKTFLSTGNSPRYERPRDASQFARHFSRLIRYKIPIIIPRDLERRKSACKRQSYLRDKFSIICQIILL